MKMITKQGFAKKACYEPDTYVQYTLSTVTPLAETRRFESASVTVIRYI